MKFLDTEIFIKCASLCTGLLCNAFCLTVCALSHGLRRTTTGHYLMALATADSLFLAGDLIRWMNSSDSSGQYRYGFCRYSLPRPTQPFIPPGSVNEDQLHLRRQSHVWSILFMDILRDSSTTSAITERFWYDVLIKQRYICCTFTFTFNVCYINNRWRRSLLGRAGRGPPTFWLLWAAPISGRTTFGWCKLFLPIYCHYDW